MKNRTRLFRALALFSLLLMGGTSLRAVPITVSWGSESEARYFANASGTLLPVGSLVLLGSFAAGTDFAGHAGDYSYLSAQFTQYAVAHIGDGGFGIPGAFAASSLLNLSSTQLYYWAFDASTALSASQWGVFTQTTGLWTTPGGPAPGSLNTDIADANSASVGSLSVELARTASFQSVDEPWPWHMNLLVLGILLTVMRAAHGRRPAGGGLI